jgi:hypothetical protein
MKIKGHILECCHLWDIAPCSPYVNIRFGETYHLHLQGKIPLPLTLSTLYNWHPGWRLTLTGHLLHAGFLLGWLSTLKMEVRCSSETSVHIRTTQCHVPELPLWEHQILQAYSYKHTGWCSLRAMGLHNDTVGLDSEVRWDAILVLLKTDNLELQWEDTA